MTARRAVLVFCVVAAGALALWHHATTFKLDPLREHWQEKDAQMDANNKLLLRAYEICKARQIKGATPLMDCISQEMR